MVNALCPSDALTPDGTASGLARFIDAYVGGHVESGSRAQGELFRAGIAAAEASCLERFNKPFGDLSEADARGFLQGISRGDADIGFPLSSWMSDVVDPALKHACFCGPVYGRFGTRMFVKMFG
jgi:gluconate 2-dehydrogenase gamma chain